MIPPLPPPKHTRGRVVTYVAWGTCCDCKEQYPVSAAAWKRLDFNGGRCKPRCTPCYAKFAKERKELGLIRNKFSKHATLAGIPKGQIKSVRLRKAPASGVPRYNPLTKKWYIPYLLKSDKRKDERRVYLEATTEEEAVEEARDWYLKALLHGATWLPDGFVSDDPLTGEQKAIAERLRMIWNKAKRKAPIVTSIKKFKVRVIQYRYKVIVLGKVAANGIKSRTEAVKLARKLSPRKRALDPLPKKCKLCGQRPTIVGKKLIHENVLCGNLVGIVEKTMSVRYKIAVWNELLRFGDFAGQTDFRREHVLLTGWHSVKGMVRFEPKTDPLDGFEI